LSIDVEQPQEELTKGRDNSQIKYGATVTNHQKDWPSINIRIKVLIFATDLSADIYRHI
jgi:hypothetical protein